MWRGTLAGPSCVQGQAGAAMLGSQKGREDTGAHSGGQQVARCEAGATTGWFVCLLGDRISHIPGCAGIHFFFIFLVLAVYFSYV